MCVQFTSQCNIKHLRRLRIVPMSFQRTQKMPLLSLSSPIPNRKGWLIVDGRGISALLSLPLLVFSLSFPRGFGYSSPIECSLVLG